MNEQDNPVELNESLEDATRYAKKFLEDVLSFFGLNTDVHATTNEDDIIELHVPSTHLNGFLIGQRGETIRALQFMVGNALRNNQFQHSRVQVDIADYKKQRAERLAEKAMDWIKNVKDTGEPMHVRPMNSADRRVIHKVATDEGLQTESEGEGRDRHVVLKKADGGTETPAEKPDEPESEDSEPKNEE